MNRKSRPIMLERDIFEGVSITYSWILKKKFKNNLFT